MADRKDNDGWKVVKSKKSKKKQVAQEQVEANQPAVRPASSGGNGGLVWRGVNVEEELVRNIYSQVGLDERARAEIVHSGLGNLVLGLNDKRVLTLTNREAVELRSGIPKDLCCQLNHRANDQMDTARIRQEQDIATVLKKHQNVVGVVIDFVPHFKFSQLSLAQALFDHCPLLEHLEWTTEQPKAQFLHALNHLDLRFLTCWKVHIVEQDVELAVNVLLRRANNQLRSLSVGRHLATFLARLNTASLEWLEVTTQGEPGQQQFMPLNIEQCHRLKVLSHVNDAQQYLAEPTIAAILENNPQLETLRIQLRRPDDIEATAVLSIAEFCRNISTLAIITEPNYYHDDDWFALSTLHNLRSLSLTGMSPSYEFFDGIALILLKCTALQQLSVEHIQDVDSDDEMLTLNQGRLRLAVVKAPLDPISDRFHPVQGIALRACLLRFKRRRY